ncbi:ATP-binding protein [Nocardia sp. CDC153]|uniref:ATP-binding protein n=1 Tax=Nocardia sp. CDC153 TaxID=3112167 RepID=UPI003FA35EE4
MRAMTTPPWLSREDGERFQEFDLDVLPVWHIRNMVRALLVPGTGILVEDAVLVVDELVSNALAHGRPPWRCRVSLLSSPTRLRVEVDDCGAGEPYVATPGTAPGGRGIVLVDCLANAWGVVRYPGFKTVWAELPLDRPNFRVANAAPPP